MFLGLLSYYHNQVVSFLDPASLGGGAQTQFPGTLSCIHQKDGSDPGQIMLSKCHVRTKRKWKRWCTSRDSCCKVPSPQSPFAMMDRCCMTSDDVTSLSMYCNIWKKSRFFLPLTLIIELIWDIVKVHSCTKYWVHRSSVQSWERWQTYTHTHTHRRTGPILLPQPLTPEVKMYVQRRLGH